MLISLMREVFCEDVNSWFVNNQLTSKSSIVASIPDISEFQGISVQEYRSTFINFAKLFLEKTPDDMVTIFYQSDIKIDGIWLDKSYLCQRAAEEIGSSLLWHKMIARVRPGFATFGRPAYSHIVAFSKKKKLLDLKSSTPDILPLMGEKQWERGMGLNAMLLIVEFLKKEIAADTLVNPFCGHGGILAVANAYELNAIGIERSEKRARISRDVQYSINDQNWS